MPAPRGPAPILSYATRPQSPAPNALATASLVSLAVLAAVATLWWTELLPELPLAIAAVIASLLTILLAGLAARRSWHGRTGGIRAFIALCLGLFAFLASSVTLASIIEMHRRSLYHARSACASRLRLIGQGCLLYTNDQMRYPDRLGKLITHADLPASAFVCPSGDETEATGATPQQLADALDDPRHCSYIYLGSGLGPDAPATAVVAYERSPRPHGPATGIHILRADGTVTWLAAGPAADASLRAHPPPPPATAPATAPVTRPAR